MLLLPESALLLIGGRFYRPLQVTDIWLFDLQCLNRVDKLAHAHRTRQEVFLILKHHVIAEILARCCAWRTAAGKNLRYYMVFENEENLLPGAVSMSQFIDTVKAL